MSPVAPLAPSPGGLAATTCIAAAPAAAAAAPAAAAAVAMVAVVTVTPVAVTVAVTRAPTTATAAASLPVVAQLLLAVPLLPLALPRGPIAALLVAAAVRPLPTTRASPGAVAAAARAARSTAPTLMPAFVVVVAVVMVLAFPPARFVDHRHSPRQGALDRARFTHHAPLPMLDCAAGERFTTTTLPRCRPVVAGGAIVKEVPGASF